MPLSQAVGNLRGHMVKCVKGLTPPNDRRRDGPIRLKYPERDGIPVNDFLTGQQVLQRAMRLCRTKEQRNALLQLGGNECKTLADFSTDQYAYVVVPIWCPPSDDGIAIPLPTDLLSQQTQITATIAPTSAFWVGPYSGIGGGLPPSSFSDAFFIVEQLVMADRGQSMANDENMMRDAYGMPLAGGFDQQELVIPLQATAATQPATLTGFRAGSCKSIEMWLTKNSDSANPGRWYAPKSVVALYAGTIYANFVEGTSQIFNLLDGTAPAAVDYSALSPVGAGPATSSGVLNTWVSLPFGQPTGNDYAAEVFTHGKEITNGIVNLQIQTPDASAYTLHVVYNYNCTAVISKGSAELLF